MNERVVSDAGRGRIEALGRLQIAGGTCALSDIVNDLYTLSRNRWTLYQQYEGKTLNRAIGDAEKLLASKKVDAVGIIREGPERRSGPAIFRVHYGGHTYIPHIDHIQLREGRVDYAVHRYQHQFQKVKSGQ